MTYLLMTIIGTAKPLRHIFKINSSALIHAIHDDYKVCCDLTTYVRN